MKASLKMLLITILGFCAEIAISQELNSLESTKQALAKEKDPLKRFTLIETLRLGGAFSSGRVMDSIYCIESLKIAQQLKNDSLLAIAYNALGSFFIFNKGDIAIGLESYYKGIPLAEQAHDKRRLSSLYFDIAAAQLQLKNYEEVIKQTRLGFQNLPAKSEPLFSFMYIQYTGKMTEYFLDTQQKDSAIFYAAKHDSVSHLVPWEIFAFAANCYEGAAYSLDGNNRMANEYFEKALAMFSKMQVTGTDGAFIFFNYYIPFLIDNKRFDDAISQAHTLEKIGIDFKNNILKLRAAKFLKQGFDGLQNLDSAYYYANVEADLNEKIFNDGNRNKIQSLAINEQVRLIEEQARQRDYETQLQKYSLIGGLVIISIIGLILYGRNREKHRANKVLESTLTNLKSTQSQLIQSEKMASLGELTAGIAHEIQNPLNFVNNFSEVSSELVDEMKTEMATGNVQLATEISNDLKQNLEKINHHGKRAADIVKGMLQHSRSSSGVKEATNINALADEYLRLAYHGLRAKDKSFNATMKTDFDETIGNINVVPQDIGRVILNLITNAFYAVNERASNQQRTTINESYQPTVTVTTNKTGAKIEIRVKDNGNGIPQKILDKIFQPFFTTKPTGQGTGLGLSLSYDIVKAHGGELRVETKVDEGSLFIVTLPIA
jgi:two-component system, NtrC family, sensor kinase